MSARTASVGTVLSGNKTVFSGSWAILAFTLPVAVILCACFYVSYTVLRLSAQRVDSDELKAEQRIARDAIDSATTPIVKLTRDYAYWDELYRRAKEPLDPQWADAHLGSYQHNLNGVTASAVMTKTGAVQYLYLSARSVIQHPTQEDLRLLKSLTQAVVNESGGIPERPRSGFIVTRNRPVFVAIAPIRASGLEGGPKGAKPYASLMFVLNFDSVVLSNISRNFNLADAHIVTAKSANFVLPSFPGMSETFGLQWKRTDPSREIIKEKLPWLYALAAISLLLIAAIAGGWAWILVRVRKAETATLMERATIAEHAAEAKSLFIANTSHELRTPLNAIIGFSEMLTSQLFGPSGHPKYVEYAEDILASGRHLLAIVNDILLMSKLDAKKYEYEVGAVPIELVVQEAITLISNDAAKRGVVLDFKNSDEGLTVFADRQALKQVVINLLSNAVKFSFAAGRIDVAIRDISEENIVELRIADHGCGMSKEFLKTLGTPFTQASHAYLRNNQGTGLGLSICFAFVAGFGGALEFESAETLGTKATLRLRLSQSKRNVAFSRMEANAA